MSFKQEKVIVIISEFVNDKREFYPITNVPVEKARFFYKDDDGLFKVMASSDYAVRTELNETRLYITNVEIKEKSTKFQVGYEINFTSSEYETSLPVLSVLVEMYNNLIEDSRTIFNYVKKQCFISDDKTTSLVLPNLPSYCVWCMGENGEMFALPVNELYSKFEEMLNKLKSILADYTESKKEEIRGATFFPHLMEDGTLSWTNDKDKPNPKPVNIKGPAGTIENVTASVNSNAGVPSVKVTMSGTKENRSFDLKFENLKGDKPIKGTDYYTPAEKEQFTNDTKAIIQTEGNKVVEQVKNIVAGNPAESNALTLSGKTRVEFEQDTEKVREELNQKTSQINTILAPMCEPDYIKDVNMIEYSTGKLVSINNWITKIYNVSSLKGATIKVISDIRGEQAGFAFYDKYENYISGFNTPNTNKTVPENAEWIAISSYYGIGVTVPKEKAGILAPFSKRVVKDTNLKKELELVENEIIETAQEQMIKTWDLGYLETDGSFISSEGYHTSKFIILNNISKIIINTVGYNAKPAVAFYDEEENFISSMLSVGQMKRYIIDSFPKNAKFVRFVIQDVYPNQKLKIFSKKLATKKELKKELELIENEIIEITQEQMMKDWDLGRLEENGYFVSTNSYHTSKRILVKDISKFILKSFALKDKYAYAFYDDEEKFISGGKSNGELTEYIIDKFPENAKFVRFSIVDYKTGQNLITYYKKYADKQEVKNSLTNKKLIATGDSITATVSHRPYAGYAKLIALDNGMDYKSFAIWGASIADNIPETSGCILRTLDKMPDDTDYVILSGGANDIYAVNAGREQMGTISYAYDAQLDETTLCGALESMCKKALKKWHSKKILYVITHRIGVWSSQKEYETEEKCVENIIKILEKWGIPYVDLFHSVPCFTADVTMKNLYTTMGNTEYNGVGDGLHPNLQGYRLFYVPRIQAKLLTL